MATEYREIRPSARLARTIECFWIMRHGGFAVLHRVVPDACADILFTRNGSSATLDAVGAMTTYRDYPLRDGEIMAGVRFHPGMWRAALGVPGDRITDGIVPLDSLWGARSRQLLDRLAEMSPQESLSLFEAALPAAESTTPLQKALAWMVDRRGLVSIDDIAYQAGFSTRQFRRVCLEHTGLSPKVLARVLRFRHALARVRDSRGQLAGLALDCGYYDQAHLINEFRELSGHTPASCGMTDFSNRAAAASR